MTAKDSLAAYDTDPECDVDDAAVSECAEGAYVQV